MGYLEVHESEDHETVFCSLDLDAVHFFKLVDDSFEDIFDSPHAALKALVFLSPRFRAALEPDKNRGVTETPHPWDRLPRGNP